MNIEIIKPNTEASFGISQSDMKNGKFYYSVNPRGQVDETMLYLKVEKVLIFIAGNSVFTSGNSKDTRYVEAPEGTKVILTA